jgi:hypothetical protein
MHNPSHPIPSATMTKDRTMEPYIGFSVKSSLLQVLAEGYQPNARGGGALCGLSRAPQQQHQQNQSHEAITAMIRDALNVIDDDDMVDVSISSS